MEEAESPKERESQRAARLEALNREIQIGIDQMERGEVVPWDVEQIKAKVREVLERCPDKK